MQIPEVGDRVAVYQYVPHNPTPRQVQECLANHWLYAPSPSLKRLRWWGEMPVVVLRRYRKEEAVWLAITSAEFPEPLRSEGVKVPLTHIEILERGYGLPERNIALVEKPAVATVIPLAIAHEQRRLDV